MKNSNALALILISSLAVSACGGRGRVLKITSDPTDADVCIKGKGGSEYFSNKKSCVGTTPFEDDKVMVMNRDGDKNEVSFKDVEGDKESFYVLVTRPGYVAQSFEVPKWEHHVTLKSEAQAMAAPAQVVLSMQHQQPQAATPVPVAASEQQATAPQGSVRVTSEPLGALVYINGVLKGNTPYVHAGPTGKVRVKVELQGFTSSEKDLEVNAGASTVINMKLDRIAEKPAAPGEPAIVPAAAPGADQAAPAPQNH